MAGGYEAIGMSSGREKSGTNLDEESYARKCRGNGGRVRIEEGWTRCERRGGTAKARVDGRQAKAACRKMLLRRRGLEMVGGGIVREKGMDQPLS